MMSDLSEIGTIHVHDLNLWAHVGVEDHERLLGQSFLLNFSLWVDLLPAASRDDLSLTMDYSSAIKSLQQLSFETRCLTLETFSELILDHLEELYGIVPMSVSLKKCSPPIHGFSGSVSIERKRHFPLTNE